MSEEEITMPSQDLQEKLDNPAEVSAPVSGNGLIQLKKLEIYNEE